MATKEEWTEYFALINDRQPSADEILIAIEKGDIDLGYAESKNNTQVSAEITEDANRAYVNAKQHAGNYWTWVKPLILRPSQNKNVSGGVFLWVTFAVASVLGAWSLSNIIRRGINSALASYSSFSNETASIRSQLNTFNMQFFVYSVIIFALMYLAAVPGLMLINRHTFSMKETLTKYLKWFAPLTLVNLVGVVLSFIIPIPSISVWSLSNISSVMQTLFSSFGIVTIILILGSIVLVTGQQFLIAEANESNKKIDAFWLVLIQWIISIIIIIIELEVIVAPLLQSLAKSVANV
ncbi:MAG: hypothetical protein ACRCY1_03760 [Leuconostoc suionicum]|uniref:hypothetical protein n=1 Tax=Leuconostoc suionicum TaxID=1511761 RepID=UPI003F36C815